MKTIGLLLVCLAGFQEGDPVAKLVEQFDADQIETRDSAQEALVKLGRPALPSIRKAFATASGESRTRIERVIRAITEPRWMTDIESAREAAKKAGKPLFVFSTIGDPDGFV